MTAAARILAAIADGPLSQIDIRFAAEASRSTVSATLGKLVAAGEVERIEGASGVTYGLPAIVEEVVAIDVTVEALADLAALLEVVEVVEVAPVVEVAVAAPVADAAPACDDCYAEACDDCQPYCSRSTIEPAPVAPKPAKVAKVAKARKPRYLATLLDQAAEVRVADGEWVQIGEGTTVYAADNHVYDINKGRAGDLWDGCKAQRRNGTEVWARLVVGELVGV